MPSGLFRYRSGICSRQQQYANSKNADQVERFRLFHGNLFNENDKIFIRAQSLFPNLKQKISPLFGNLLLPAYYKIDNCSDEREKYYHKNPEYLFPPLKITPHYINESQKRRYR